MRIIALIVFLSFASFSWADDLRISNIKMRPALKAGYPTTLYLNIENISNQLDYLVGVEIIEYPKTSISINKTVIEKNIARIIHINQLAIPSNSTIKLSPGGIYVIINELLDEKSFTIRFIFKHHGVITENFTYK